MPHTQNNHNLSYTLKQFVYFVFKYGKYKIWLLIGLMLLAGLIPSVESIFLQKITDAIESYSDLKLRNINLVAQLFKWIILYALWWESINFLWRSYDYAYLKIIPLVRAGVIDELFNYVQYQDHRFFQSNLAGDISSRITEGSRSLEMIFAYINEKIIRKLAITFFALVTLFTVHSSVALVFLTWIIIFLTISISFAKTVNRYSTIYSQDKAFVSGQIVDAISNISNIRMFGSHRLEHRNIQKDSTQTIVSDQALQWFMLKLRYALGFSCTVMIGFMVYYIISLRNNLEISIGQCVLIITLCISVINDVWDLTQEFGDLFEQIGVFNQSMSLLKPYGITDAEDAMELKVTAPSIEFRHVTFSYSNNANSFKKQSLLIKPFEKVGLVGFSGSGKTTFTNMITRLYDIDAGEILIDGQNIHHITQTSLRNNISIIPQEPILFHRSIKDNISYGLDKVCDVDIIQAAQNAHIHDTIMSLPEQYETICGERGNNLSGGQRQRVIIARAFLRKAPILVLDEATSSLDNHTEALIHQSLQKLMHNKTVLVIAHRLTTLLNMDRILIFDKGHIVANGTHEELQQSSQLYRDLWNANNQKL